CPVAAHCSNAFRWVQSIVHGLTNVRRSADEWRGNAVGTDVKRSLKETAIQFGHAHDQNSRASYGRAYMPLDRGPIERTMFGVNGHPIQTRLNRNCGDGRRRECAPQTEHRLVRLQLSSKLL